ncbi:MAG: FAD-binding protein [Candidatus Shapirobacteria bacterium]|jgi:UDP-N-acetylmuramate dehydrogenase
MDYDSVYRKIKSLHPTIETHLNHPLAPYTTLRLGGPADLFIHTTNQLQFISILKLVHQYTLKDVGAEKEANISKIIESEASNFSAHSKPEVDAVKEANGAQSSESRFRDEGVSTGNSFTSQPPLTILGSGSNVLISDSGIRGIVIKNSSRYLKIQNNTSSPIPPPTLPSRLNQYDPKNYLNFQILDYDETSAPRIKVRLASGVPLPFAIATLIRQGVTGLQWFGYIPGTIGGAVLSNIHGGSHFFSEIIQSVTCYDLSEGKIIKIPAGQISWGYDHCSLADSPHLVILSVTLNLFKGDATKAAQTAAAWIAQKAKVQPPNSAGSVFQNPSEKDCLPIWGEPKSAGWIIDSLGWKGKSVGGAQVSPLHANFIVNTGSATAANFYTLFTQIQADVLNRYHLHLEPEIKLLGNF